MFCIACGLIPSWGPCSMCKECCTLQWKLMCALYQACLFPHTHLIASGCCLTELRVWIRLFSLFERILHYKPEEPSRYSSLKCIQRLYSAWVWGFFCHLLTGVNIKVSRSLKGTSSWLCLLWHWKCVPAAEDAETYSYSSFGTAEK